jgi:single-strand DNA-binding protein
MARPVGPGQYTTEVVLQGINAQLTMLDSKGAGGGDYGAEDSGTTTFGSAGPAPRRQPAPALAGAKSGDLNDEIPF